MSDTGEGCFWMAIGCNWLGRVLVAPVHSCHQRNWNSAGSQCDALVTCHNDEAAWMSAQSLWSESSDHGTIGHMRCLDNRAWDPPAHWTPCSWKPAASLEKGDHSGQHNEGLSETAPVGCNWVPCGGIVCSWVSTASAWPDVEALSKTRWGRRDRNPVDKCSTLCSTNWSGTCYTLHNGNAHSI